MTRWHRKDAKDLKRDSEALLAFYDPACEAVGAYARKVGCTSPMALVRKGHVTIYESLDAARTRRVELDERAAEVLLDKLTPRFVTKKATVEEVVGAKVVWIGADPQRRYDGCAGWYGRKINGKLRARVMVELPLPNAQPDEAAEEAKRMAKLRRRAFRLG